MEMQKRKMQTKINDNQRFLEEHTFNAILQTVFSYLLIISGWKTSSYPFIKSSGITSSELCLLSPDWSEVER